MTGGAGPAHAYVYIPDIFTSMHDESLALGTMKPNLARFGVALSDAAIKLQGYETASNKVAVHP